MLCEYTDDESYFKVKMHIRPGMYFFDLFLFPKFKMEGNFCPDAKYLYVTSSTCNFGTYCTGHQHSSGEPTHEFMLARAISTCILNDLAYTKYARR